MNIKMKTIHNKNCDWISFKYMINTFGGIFNELLKEQIYFKEANMSKNYSSKNATDENSYNSENEYSNNSSNKTTNKASNSESKNSSNNASTSNSKNSKNSSNCR